MLTSWKTTVAGGILIAGGIVLYLKGGDKVMAGALIVAGMGLLQAKDHNVA